MRTLALFCLALLIGVPGMSFSQASDASQFDPSEIRETTTRLIAALQDTDPTAWVYMYTKDAVLLEPGSAPVEGRDALLAMAKSMQPLSSVVISLNRTEGQGNLANMYGHASWVNGRPPSAGSPSNVYFVIVWRKETDGQWRVAQEVFVPDTPRSNKCPLGQVIPVSTPGTKV